MNRLPVSYLAFARVPFGASGQSDGVTGDQAQERR